MYLKEIWRYPVKSMAGEQLQSADITINGIAGDRIVRASGKRGGTVTARSRPGLLGHRGKIGAAGEFSEKVPGSGGGSLRTPARATTVKSSGVCEARNPASKE